MSYFAMYKIDCPYCQHFKDAEPDELLRHVQKEHPEQADRLLGEVEHR